jgi:hypothetical protein
VNELSFRPKYLRRRHRFGESWTEIVETDKAGFSQVQSVGGQSVLSEQIA